MRRRLFTLLSAVSLTLCLASIVMWARSYGGSDYVTRGQRDAVNPTTTHMRTMQWTLGQIRFERGDQTYFPPTVSEHPTGTQVSWSHGRLGVGHFGWERLGGDATVWNRLGFCRYQTGMDMSFASILEEGVTAPAWIPVALFAILPAAWCVVVWRSRCRMTAGLCAACGYDLRATPGRCPECGTTPQGKAA